MGKKQDKNKGSTLLLVIISISFIAILGSIIMGLTLSNLKMKKIDEQSKKNFYEAESILAEIKGSIEEIATDSLKDAYEYVLTNYMTVPAIALDTAKFQDEMYLKGIVETLTRVEGGTNYYPTEIKKHMRDDYKDRFLNTDGPGNLIEYHTGDTREKRYVIIHGIKVQYYNSQNDQIVTLSTDIVISCRDFEYTMQNVYPEWTKYAIIADTALTKEIGTTSSTISGNIYAGAQGICVKEGTLCLLPSTLISRGNISSYNKATLTIGDSAQRANIWAESLTTEQKKGVNEPAKLSATGNCFISDDLRLNAKQSEVSLTGEYLGFSFNRLNRKKSDALYDPADMTSEYSSSIIINGKNSSLDLSQVSDLKVYGRTFVSDTNIYLGQSIAVKSNQSAYLLPAKYMVGEKNPAENTGSPDMLNYIDAAAIPVSIKNLLKPSLIVNKFDKNGLIYFYWNFKNQKCANDYFTTFIAEESNKDYYEEQAKAYLDPSKSGLTVGTNIEENGVGLSFAPDGTSSLVGSVLPDPDEMNDSIVSLCKGTAMEYMARQKTLTETANGLTVDNFRFTDNNKTLDPLFQALTVQVEEAGVSMSLIKKEASESGYGFVSGVKTCTNSEGNVVIVSNAGGAPYETSAFADQKGILLATGDVKINSDFAGLIIAGGTVNVSEFGNYNVSSDIGLVQAILRKGLEDYSPTNHSGNFIHYFKDYESGSGKTTIGVGQVDIASGLNFQNFKRVSD